MNEKKMKRKFMKPRTKSVKTDKIQIPHPLHWPMDLREGIDLDGIYEFIKIPQEWLENKKKEFSESTNWKFTKPKNKEKEKEINEKKRKIIYHQMKWEKEEYELRKKCEFLGAIYEEPKNFPEKYETASERKLNFPLNYRWLDQKILYNSSKEYVSEWSSWKFHDESRRYSLERVIDKAKNDKIYELRKLKWDSFSDEQKKSIKEEELKYKEKQEYKSSRRYYEPPSVGYAYAPNGMVVEIDNNGSKEDMMDKIAELKEACNPYA